MKKYNEAEVRVIEMFIVEIALIALRILGLVIPELGWFLEQDVVLLTIITSYLVYIAFNFIEIYSYLNSEKNSPQEGDR